MVDYAELRKELYEKFHDAYHKLYVSELEEEVARLRDVLRINTEQQAEHIKSLLESWETERNILIKEIELMRAAILKVTEALNQGHIVPRSGVSGMTIDAQLRNSVYNGVPAGLIEDARELVEEINYRARKHNEKV